MSSLAQAADVSPARIAALFRQVHSYRVVMDVKETGANASALPAGASYHMDEILLRRGNGIVTYVKITTSGRTMELARQGSIFCARATGSWHCETVGGSLDALFKQTPEQLLQALGIHVAYRPIGARRLAGQAAVG